MKKGFSGKRYFYWMGQNWAKRDYGNKRNAADLPKWAISAFNNGFFNELLNDGQGGKKIKISCKIKRVA